MKSSRNAGGLNAGCVKGDTIVPDFLRILDDYVTRTYPAGELAATR